MVYVNERLTDAAKNNLFVLVFLLVLLLRKLRIPLRLSEENSVEEPFSTKVGKTKYIRLFKFTGRTSTVRQKRMVQHEGERLEGMR